MEDKIGIVNEWEVDGYFKLKTKYAAISFTMLRYHDIKIPVILLSTPQIITQLLNLSDLLNVKINLTSIFNVILAVTECYCDV